MAGSSRETAPVDFDVLGDVRKYLVRSDRFKDVKWRPDYAPDSPVCIYDGGLYPASVDEAFLQITWFKNDDFHVHHQDAWADTDEKECRWDRHRTTTIRGATITHYPMRTLPDATDRFPATGRTSFLGYYKPSTGESRRSGVKSGRLRNVLARAETEELAPCDTQTIV